MIIKFKKQKINIPLKKASLFGKFSGLMFKSKNAENILFEFRKKTRITIHSFFVFFPFLIIWLDDDNFVVEKRIVKPFIFGIAPKKPYKRIIEVPFNIKNKKIIEFFVGRGRFK